MDRTILHCDLNSFYASVECIFNPKLKTVPMAVAGDPENRRGIILAKNELAKGFKVQTAETIWQAKRKCPDLVLVPPRHDLYQKYSDMVNEIYNEYTDLVEKFGIDESWLDVTGSTHLFGSGEKIANTLRERIKKEIGLTISVGVSFNKVFAKLGSDYKKPDATTVILRDNFRQIVYPLPVSALLFVGKNTAEAFLKMNIKTIGDLASADREMIKRRFGKSGEQIHRFACGEDDSPVRAADDERELKSVGNGLTFRRNLVGEEDILKGVIALSDKVASRMRRLGVKCTTVQVMIRSPEFKTISRQKTLIAPTHTAKEIAHASMEIIKKSWDLKAPIRMITVTGCNLVAGEGCIQMSLFEEENAEAKKQEQLEKAIDLVRAKYGKTVVKPAMLIDNDIGIEEYES